MTLALWQVFTEILDIKSPILQTTTFSTKVIRCKVEKQRIKSLFFDDICLKNGTLMALNKVAVKPDENRRHRRFAAPSNFIKKTHFKCIDISESGLQFSSHKNQLTGKVFSVTLNLGQQEITIKCKVMWCRKSASIYSDEFFFGIAFVDHSITEQLAIRSYIDKALAR